MRTSVAAVSLLVTLGACGGPATADAAKGEIAVELREHTITLSAATVRAGTVKFEVRNTGGQVHDFVVLRTDTPPERLAVDAGTARAREEGRAGGLEQMPPGRSAALRLDLLPGAYVLICNVPTHYSMGMRTALTVK